MNETVESIVHTMEDNGDAEHIIVIGGTCPGQYACPWPTNRFERARPLKIIQIHESVLQTA